MPMSLSLLLFLLRLMAPVLFTRTARRLTSINKVAAYLKRTDRTVRTYIGEGYFPAYRVPGVRGLMVDLNEVDDAMARLPAFRCRSAYSSYGPKSDIRSLPVQPEVVPPKDQR